MLYIISKIMSTLTRIKSKWLSCVIEWEYQALECSLKFDPFIGTEQFWSRVKEVVFQADTVHETCMVKSDKVKIIFRTDL